MTHDLRCMGPVSRETIQRNITKSGVNLVGVLADPVFTYTIGLTATLNAEILVIGFPIEHVGTILNNIARSIRSGEGIITDGPDDRWCNYPVWFKRATDPLVHTEYVIQADHFYGKQVNVLQMVLCDRRGVFPWQPGFDHAYMDPIQPLLFS